MAQNVYSLNVVGYVNIPLIEGFQLIANQLDFDGTGTNNTTVNVLGTNTVPVGTTVYTWSGTKYNIASLAKSKTGVVAWNATNTLAPGEGAWVNVPTGGLTGTSSNLTTVGQVDQGALVNTHVPAAGGYSLVSSMIPLAGGLQTVLGYSNPQVGDQVYQWSITQGKYVINSFTKSKTGVLAWTPAEPSIAVGEGFWLNSQAGGVWSNYFTVQ